MPAYWVASLSRSILDQQRLVRTICPKYRTKHKPTGKQEIAEAVRDAVETATLPGRSTVLTSMSMQCGVAWNCCLFERGALQEFERFFTMAGELCYILPEPS